MTDPTQKPVIFLAFAQDREDKVGYLRNLPKELDGIRKALQKARQAGLCEVVERANTTVDNILDVFQEYRDRVAIFHYGGHAGSYELLLESASGEHQLAHSEGLISFLAKQMGLQMVFLNGCSSQQQALDLLEAGVPAVVGTSQKINDEVATGLSLRFYKGLAQGATIDRAWQEAVDQVKVEKGTGNFRDLFGDESEEEAPDRFPWEIYFREGAEVVKDWNLPEAVENPLFGLPPIPKTHDLPETPFLFLKRYERQHAEIFFGRSYYIRELYNRVSDAKSPPVILLYGQSGVGKSSLFDAGLNPRLENEYKVIYIRRIQEKGLAGTLEYALEQEFAELPEPSQSVSEEPGSSAKDEISANDQTLSQLEAAAKDAQEKVKDEIEALIQRLKNDQAFKRKEPPEGGTTNPLPTPYSELPTSREDDLLAKWQSIETLCKKPIILILDQVEELYTRPNKELPDELADFLLALRSIFGSPSQRPRGKLILGYRKEYHPEIEEGFKTFLLPRCTVFLEPLRRKDILEVFRGVSQTSGLKQFYNLSVEDDLPVIIADDLLEDRESPVAPVLQIVLTKMWNAAKKENPDSPRFTIEQYQQLKKDGIAMGEFFEQQMRQLRRWNADIVDSGLALDVLHFHITALGTAGTRSLEELRETYQHRQDILDKLVGKCKELYLLTEAQHSADHTSLTHDTLAPVVNNEYNNSDKPGQRASRILNSKMGDFSENGKQVWLDEADLAVVEQGNEGMRKLSEPEEALLKKSREKRRQRQRLRKRLWAGGVVMLIGIIATMVVALVLMRLAEREARRSKSQFLASKAEKVSNADNTKAMRIAQAAYSLVENDPLVPVVQVLASIYDRRAKVPFYQELPDKNGVKFAVFSRDGKQILTAREDSTARLWSLTSDFEAVFEHDAPVMSAAFSPDGQRIVTTSLGKHARLWSVAGDSLAVFKHKDARSAVFSPNGQQVLTASPDGTVRLWTLAGDSLEVFKHDKWVNTAVFSPDGQQVLTASRDNTAQLWSLAGDSLTVFKHGFWVISAVFSPDSQKILTASLDGTARLWSLAGDSLAVFKHDGPVRSAVFSPNGQKILTASKDNTARLWSLAGDSLAVFKHDGTVRSAVFSPNGQKILTVSTTRVRLWSLAGDALKVFKHDDWVNSAVFSAGGQQILTASGRKTVRLWSLAGDATAIFKHKRTVNSAVFSFDGQQILTASSGGMFEQFNSARLWSLAGDSLKVFKHKHNVNAAVFSPNGQQILTVSNETFGQAKSARLWSLAGDSLAIFEHKDDVNSAVFSPDGQQILTASDDSTARLWSLAGDSLAIFKHNNGVNAAVFSANGQQILTASDDHTARLWSLAGDSLTVFRHGNSVRSAVFSANGQKILTASRDRTARLWSLAGDSLKVFRHIDGVNFAVFSPDGEKILTASRDNTARYNTAWLWSIGGDALAGFKHGVYVASAVFSPDGQQILTAARDKTARLWSLAGDSLAVFKHKYNVISAAFSPNGQQVLTVSQYSAAQLWLTPKGIYEWLKTAKIYRLSEQEKREYGIIE